MMLGVELLMDVLENWEWRYVVSSKFSFTLHKSVNYRLQIQCVGFSVQAHSSLATHGSVENNTNLWTNKILKKNIQTTTVINLYKIDPKIISAAADGITERITEGGFSHFETLFQCQTITVNHERTDVLHYGECHASARGTLSISDRHVPLVSLRPFH